MLDDINFEAISEHFLPPWVGESEAPETSWARSGYSLSVQ